MPRLIVIVVSGVLVALSGAAALADDGSATQGPLLSWPGKQGAPPQAAATAAPDGAAVALPKQFFAATPGADLAAPPGPPAPHAVPGSATVSNPSTANTAANRARADMLTPTGDQSTDQ